MNCIMVSLVEYATMKDLLVHAVKFEFKSNLFKTIYLKATDSKQGRKWVITSEDYCWSKKFNQFVYEPTPSNRTQEFIEDTRFDRLEEAYDLLCKLYEGNE